MSPYAKTIVAGLVTVLYAIVAAVTDRQVTQEETLALVILVLDTFGVYFVPNNPPTTTTTTVRRP